MACVWPQGDPLMQAYHDQEWGVPVYEDAKWFEYLCLDSFQAGLSWKTVLYKRENFREAFHGFNPEKVAKMTADDVLLLKQNAGIIRNEQKIRATIKNAKAFLKIQEGEGSFSDWIWRFTDGQMLVNKLETESERPANTALSDQLSIALKKEGFSFVGSTIVYAFMQAAGMVNDHLVSCKRHQEVQDLVKPKKY